jgi:orotidine-5'-phosphate decarboxylase
MKSKLIVALDVENRDRAANLVDQLAGHVDLFKVGLQLFTKEGPAIIQMLTDRRQQCFLDLKFHDIPNTVANAVESASALHVAMLTLHTAGGGDMLRAAAQVPGHSMLLGVTVLTSVAGNVTEEVVRRARLAAESGLEGVVASAHEIQAIREAVGGTLRLVIPGIRPAWAKADDQKRMMTPREAVLAGADYLVVGRPIISAAKPAEAAQRVRDEMASA